MKSSFDLYGFPITDLSKLTNTLASVLSVEWSLHESSYLGEYYRSGLPGEEEFILQHNFDDYEKEWAESNFKDYPILLYVNNTSRSDQIKDLIFNAMNDDVELLRQEIL